MQRNQTLDLFRGLTIILMIIFHISFDLNHFNFVELDLKYGEFWRYFRKIIVGSFVFIMGYTLVISYGKNVVWGKVLKRFRMILFFALLITFATYIVFPQSYIYFGVLHFMALSTLVGVLFVKRPWLSLFLALFIFTGYTMEFLDARGWMKELKPILGLPKTTEDFVFFVPWWSAMFLGIFMGYFKVIPALEVSKKLNFVSFLGRHSLATYMIHQPIIFGVMLLFTKFL